jgi:hypothetical protein
MKTLLIFLGIIEMLLLASPGKNKYSYVITNNDTLYCQSISVGTAKLNCVLKSGEKLKMPYNEVLSYFDGQTTRVKLPVYVNGKQTGELGLMELIGCENGIYIYKYENFNLTTESTDVIISYYDKNGYLNSQTNPALEQVNEFVASPGLMKTSEAVSQLLSEN